MKAGELRGEALQVYETWRAVGLSEADALDEVREAGLLNDLDAFDRFARVFEALGLPADEARIAAVGRDGTEWRARESFAVARARLSLAAEVERAREAVVAAMVHRDGPSEAAARGIVERNMGGRPLAEQLEHCRRYLDRFGRGSVPRPAAVESTSAPRRSGRWLELSETTETERGAW